MNKILTTLTVSALTVGAVAMAAPAQADYSFTVCDAPGQSGMSGVLNGVTTCDFADNMRSSWYVNGGPYATTAYSPAMNRQYTMYCSADQIVTLAGRGKRLGVLCTGGDTNDAELVFW